MDRCHDLLAPPPKFSSLSWACSARQLLGSGWIPGSASALKPVISRSNSHSASGTAALLAVLDSPGLSSHAPATGCSIHFHRPFSRPTFPARLSKFTASGFSAFCSPPLFCCIEHALLSILYPHCPCTIHTAHITTLAN